jgi:hypothetical protein
MMLVKEIRSPGPENRDKDTLEDDDDTFRYKAAPAALLMTGSVQGPPIYNTEGWPAIDAMSPESVSDLSWRMTPLHFCQRYYLEPYVFAKYRLPGSGWIQWNRIKLQPLLCRTHQGAQNSEWQRRLIDLHSEHI